MSRGPFPLSRQKGLRSFRNCTIRLSDLSRNRSDRSKQANCHTFIRVILTTTTATPPFLEEWQESDESVMVLGHWCLCMVQASLQTYLQDSISTYGFYWWKPSSLIARLSHIKKADGTFQRYRLLFRDHLGIDWEKGPVAIADLEQLNLTRNNLIHPIDIMSFSVKRDEKHAEGFPIGLFIDDLWKGLDIERIRPWPPIGERKIAVLDTMPREVCTMANLTGVVQFLKKEQDRLTKERWLFARRFNIRTLFYCWLVNCPNAFSSLSRRRGPSAEQQESDRGTYSC
jgi:hypothetical protein